MNQPLMHPAVTHDVSCVLYEPHTGKIVFTHRITALGDAARPSEQELEEEARSLLEHDTELYAARSNGQNIAALIVSSDTFRPGYTYSVNCKDHTLVALPRSRQAK